MHATSTFAQRYIEFALEQIAFTGASENSLLLCICRRLNQPPPLTLFPQHGTWATRHRARWVDHETVFSKIASTRQLAWAAELPSLQPLYSIALKCLEWHPDARYRANGLVSALRAVEGWQFTGVHSSVGSSSDLNSSRANGSGRRHTEPSRSFTQLARRNSNIALDLDPESDVAEGPTPSSKPGPSRITHGQVNINKRRRLSCKTPPELNLNLSSSNTAMPILICSCSSQNCRSSTHARGQACSQPRLPGSDYCSSCKCRDCPLLRRGNSGLCRTCSAKDLPWGLRLVRIFGEIGLLHLMTPVDVEALAALHENLLAVDRSDPVLLFIAAWAKDPVFVQHLSHGAPGCDCSAAELQRHIHNTLRSIAGQHLAEAGLCIRGGRHTGLAFCMRWLGLATKITTTGGGQDFKGGVPFLAYNPPKLVADVGSGITFELGRSLLGLQALMNGLRAADYPSVTQRHPWSKLRDGFRAALTKVTEKYSMGLTGTYLAPHILRKFLLLNGDLPHLTVAEMEDLVPDEQQVLAELPMNLRDRGRLARALCCSDMYITCYNCLGLSRSIHSISHKSSTTEPFTCVYIYI